MGCALANRASAQSGVISTVAGDYSKDAHKNANLQAIFSFPTHVAVDGQGNLFVTEGQNDRVRRVEAGTGAVTTVAGTGVIGKSDEGAKATSARIWDPYGVAVDSAGNLFFAETGNNFIRRVDKTTGFLTTAAGNGMAIHGGEGQPATWTGISNPKGIAFDIGDNLYIADTYNDRVCRVDKKTSILTFVAGTGKEGFEGDDGDAKKATLNHPHAVAVDGAGNVFIADTYNHVVRRVDAKSGIISTFAGIGKQGFSGDGFAATQAQLFYPYGLAVDYAGNVFIADTNNNRIRRVDKKTGIITTVAGTGPRDYGGDGGPATKAQLAGPMGIAFDTSGNLFIADTGNAVIRRVERAGVPLNLNALIGAGKRTNGDLPPVKDRPIFKFPIKPK